jgi:hypothetical protein
MKVLRIEILEQIREKGDLYSIGAAAYMHDEAKGSLFIAECFEQCCHESTIRHWGIELVLKIVHYRVEMIKYPLKLIEEELKLMDPARINRTGRAD